MKDSIFKNHLKLLVTGKCTNKCNANVETRRRKERNRKSIDRSKRTNNQIVDNKLKDRLRKRKEKCQQTDAKNEIHRIKNWVAVTRCRERKYSVVCQPEDVLLKHLQRCAYLNARTDE